MKSKKEIQRALDLIDRRLKGEVDVPNQDEKNLRIMGTVLFWILHKPADEKQAEACQNIDNALNDIETAIKGEVSLEA